MDDNRIAAALRNFKVTKIIDASQVKIEKIGSGKPLLDKQINFGSLKPAVMINNTLFIGDHLPHEHLPMTIRQ